MKSHVGVNTESELTPSVLNTPANVNDVTQTHDLLHGEQRVPFSGAGHQSVDKREGAWDIDIPSRVAIEDGQAQGPVRPPWGELLDQAERAKASTRAKLEHPFLIVTPQFGYPKTRYPGLAQNIFRLMTPFYLADLYQVCNRMAVA